MKNDSQDRIKRSAVERLRRVQASRRGQPVELLVHYERRFVNGRYTYRLFSVEEADGGTITN